MCVCVCNGLWLSSEECGLILAWPLRTCKGRLSFISTLLIEVLYVHIDLDLILGRYPIMLLSPTETGRAHTHARTHARTHACTHAHTHRGCVLYFKCCVLLQAHLFQTFLCCQWYTQEIPLYRLRCLFLLKPPCLIRFPLMLTIRVLYDQHVKTQDTMRDDRPCLEQGDRKQRIGRCRTSNCEC